MNSSQASNNSSPEWNVDVFKNVQLFDPRTVTFTMSPTFVTFANTLRRAIQTEVQILGFRADMTEKGSTTDVTVLKNSTPMSNEMLADRIGLLPISMGGVDLINWEKENVLFSLHVVNDTDKFMNVTASDFECFEKQEDGSRKRVPNTKYFHPNSVTGSTCLLAVLKPKFEGQESEEIHLEAYATLGKGREHTRFNPTSQCAYKYSLDDDKDRINALWVKWLHEQKKVDVSELDKDEGRKEKLLREFSSLEIYRCFKVDEKNEPYSYDFTVETIGTIPVSQIVYKACMAMSVLTKKYAMMYSENIPSNVDIRQAEARLEGFDVWFTGEDHTLGNLFQTYIDAHYIGNAGNAGNATNATNDITFVGYKVPHPLRNEMVLRIGVKEGSPENTVRRVLAETAKECSDMFARWAVDWMSAAESSLPETVWKSHSYAKESQKEK